MKRPPRGKPTPNYENNLKVGVRQRPSFLFEVLRLPNKLDLQKTPPTKSVALPTIMSFFDPCRSSPLEKSLP